MTSAPQPAPTRRDVATPGQPAHRDQPGPASTRRDLPQSGAEATRRDGADPGTSAVGALLPANLAARLQVVATLPQHGAEADVFRVRDATGQDLVLKLYRPQIRPDPDVWRALPALRTPNLVRVHETGHSAGRSYELMEYLPAGNLRGLTGRRFDTATIIDVVRQLAAGLAALHAANITHRDVKPENVLLRRDDPMEFVVTDFGLSRHLDQSMIFSTAARTLIYTAPETFYDHVSFARDWWSLGVIVHELATGKRPYEGLSEHPIMMQLSRHAFGVDDVADPRLRLLCRGLLVHDFEARWGLEQVQQWLAGQSPTVPSNRGPADQPGSDIRPFLFMGEHYTEPRLLALAMAQNWGVAARQHFARLGEHFNDLRNWLAQFDDPDRFDVAARREMVDELSEPGPVDPKLLRLLAWLDPTLPPSYRGLSLDPDHLPAVAQAAANGDRDAAAVVDDLCAHQLLPVLAGFADAAALTEVDSRWRALLADVDRATGQLAKDVPQVADRLAEPESRSWACAMSLAQVASPEGISAALRDQLRQLDDRLQAPVPWFDEFLRHRDDGPTHLVVGQLVSGLAVAEAERVVREREIAASQAAARQARWHQQEQDRLAGWPPAVGWALAGVSVLLVPWLIYLGIVFSITTFVERWPLPMRFLIGGLLGFTESTPSTTFVVLGLLAVLVVAGAEVFLAWRLGRSYAPGHALLWRLRGVARRVGNLMKYRAGLVLVIFVGGIVVLSHLTIAVPPAVPLTIIAAHLLSAWRRERAWRTTQADEEKRVLGEQ